jgi:L-idonate 5-dehydrogenase
MKALKILNAQEITTAELPLPEPGDGEVRLRVTYAGICGSDLNYYFKGANGPFELREPFTPGHELSGVVDLDPSGKLAAGTPVTVAPATFGTPLRGIEQEKHLWPGGSYLGSAANFPHRQGGMAEYLIVSDYMVRVVPDGMGLVTAALAEPLAVALRAHTVVGGVAGQRVLVSGSGPIGLLVAAAAAVRGAESVTCLDMLAEPLERARSLGATATIQLGIDEVPEEAFDIVFECSGAPSAVTTALKAVRRQGTVCQVGTLPNAEVPVNLASLEIKETRYVGTFRFNDEIDDAIVLLAEHPEIAGVITHVLPAEQAAEAFAVARDSSKSGKVVVSLWTAAPGD